KQTIRFSHQAGGFKAVHATSSGKALLSVLSEDERQKWFKTYPDKPIRVIMPWAAGGPTDVVGRVIAVRMGEILGQPLVIESR
ncbi:hypothetical protein L7Q78_45870, partial [Achromobacter xylosoxidans]|nr:hypothetical protein [Achromobacter xylosoxidans]